MDFVEGYLNKTKKSIGELDKGDINEFVNIFFDAWSNSRQIFIIGNGGSASMASHFANDLNKLCSVEGKKRFKAIALTDNIPLMTAWANDSDYSVIFTEQLKNFMNDNDLVLGISGSGNSKNVINAIEYAGKNNAETLCFVGFDGGRLNEICKRSIHIKSKDYGIVEDIFMVLCHVIANYLKDKIENTGV